MNGATDVKSSARKVLVCNFLAKHNIDKIVFSYDGQGDNGAFQAESYTCEGKEFGMEIGHPVYEGLRELGLEDLAYGALESFCDGWEIDDGSFGVVTVFKDGTFNIEDNRRVMTYDERSSTGNLFEIETQ